ncbi:hypothetical protein [Caminibacter pacificus]|jgi:hypothetical protein|uniref:Uncharacterized protein n=1 Tax=Caminibacter pacificus TaxID=1424653 RepID=A0AAJ4UYT0_9BACT|nr:hypothetical protein [Caminibacter pacificus]NPA87868.1 hypothetical protein [Campylobacterota bacterium]QCI28080.1 hypothetical protein C6V80_03645 [Caminibacter pacificus]ROR41212.1 hypothetical protein EDC58_0699 [Caminibacter pacificus]
MREVFKYTFTTIAEWKKLLLVILTVSILTVIEAFPVISIVAFLFEKLIYLSIGAFLIFLVTRSKDIESYFDNLKRNSFSTFLFHFIPTASGILVALLIILTFWIMFFVLILQFTNTMYIIADPHQIIVSVENSPVLTQILLGFYSIYLMFYSYVFLGKFGEALSQETFRGAFLSMISSLIDFKYWINTFNLKYFVIYLVWSIIISVIYTLIGFTYLFVIFPAIVNNPNLGLIIIPILVGITTILTYYTFFSAYFAHLSTEA